MKMLIPCCLALALATSCASPMPADSPSAVERYMPARPPTARGRQPDARLPEIQKDIRAMRDKIRNVQRETETKGQ